MQPTFEEWLAEVVERATVAGVLTDWERSKLRAQAYERGHSPLFGATLLGMLRRRRRDK